MKLDELNKIYGTSSFVEIQLNEMIDQLGEEETKNKLSHFSCPINLDVENFLRKKAIEFDKRDFSKTTLVYWISGDGRDKELVGYYTVAEKTISIDTSVISSNDKRKLYGHGSYDQKTGNTLIPAPLIGQIGKNYADGNNTLISGSDLLQLAMRKIKLVQNIIGGRIAYLECEDIEKLKAFYTENGFKNFGRRELDGDETDLKGKYLLQYYTFI